MIRPTATLVCVLAASLCPAAAATPAELSVHDADAQIALRASIADLNLLASAVSGLNPTARLAVSFGRAALDGVLGFPSEDLGEWARNGIIVDKSITVSLALDEQAMTADYARLIASADWSREAAASGFWRLRVVVPISGASAAALVRARLGQFTWSRRGDTAELPGEPLYLAMTERKDTLVIDVVVPAFGRLLPASTTKGSRAALAIKRASFAADSRAAAALAGEGFSLWLRTTALAALGRALAREDHISQIASGVSPREAGPLESNGECRELSGASSAVFGDAALRLAGRAKAIEAEISFGGDAAVLAAAFPRAGHGLDLARRLNVSAWASVWLRDLAGLRSLARPSSLSSFPRALFLLRQCASYHTVGPRLFAWPLLLGLFADELAALGPRGASAIESVGGAVVAVSGWNPIPLAAVGAIEGTLTTSAAPIARELLAKVFQFERAAGAVTRWGRGRLRPYVESGRVGASFGGDAGEGWLAVAARNAAPSWLDGTEIAALYADETAIRALANHEPALALLAGALGMRARLFLRGDQLVLGAVIERK